MSKVKRKSKGPPRRRFKTIYVFGGTNLRKDKECVKVASELTEESLGLKGCMENSALTRGSKGMGIVLKYLMHKRMGSILYNADAFSVLPGGLRTLEEVFNIVSWAHLNIHKKPLGLLNVNGFYDGLMSFLEYAVK